MIYSYRYNSKDNKVNIKENDKEIQSSQKDSEKKIVSLKFKKISQWQVWKNRSNIKIKGNKI